MTTRQTIIKILENSRKGHIGSALSIVEILEVLYDDILKYDPHNPRWEKRDRFILSKGHGCLALYAILADKGFFPESELWNFCRPNSMLGSHPEYGKIPGIEASTGSLGHGLPIGVGMAISLKYDKSDSRVFVLLGDGECNEGSVWEAAMCASKHKLDNLTVIIDYNKYQSSGTIDEIQPLEPFVDKWKSFGFSTIEVDGHNKDELKSAFSRLPFEKGKPSAVICHTIKGKGIKSCENNLEWHNKNNLTDNEIKILYNELEKK